MALCGRMMLWVDAVGGYWVCLAEAVVLGRCGTGSARVASAGGPTAATHWQSQCHRGGPDVPILADLSRRHARIRRDGEGHLLEALRQVRLDGQPVRGTTWLSDGGRIELGEGVTLLFRRPHPLSATARLEFVSRHRTHPGADGVLLLADSCVLGPDARSHVFCRDWPREVILYRAGDDLFCRTDGRFEIDGRPCRDRGRLTWNSRVVGEGFSLKLEAMVQ